MNSTINNIDFQGKNFYIGLDVHKKNWSVTIRTQNVKMRTFSMNPNPSELHHHLQKNYPGGNYYTVYEAGFCGFWIHRQLEALGIHNIVINPADVPTTNKEKRTKRDHVDSAKLARELANGSLEAIYVPDPLSEAFRSLVRLRHKQISHRTRIRNRIKSYLHFLGINCPKDVSERWSLEYMDWLKNLSFPYPCNDDYLGSCLQDMEYTQQQIKKTENQIKVYVQQEPIQSIINKYLMSVPGIGFIIAVSLYAELIDINRFPNFNNLASYIGLVPDTYATGDKERILGITQRKNRHLRQYLIEAAWIAVEHDPALLLAFEQLAGRMKKQEAIVRIAKKLLNRIYHVWKNKQEYVKAVV